MGIRTYLNKKKADRLVKGIKSARAARKAAGKATMEAVTPSQRANAYRQTRLANEKTRQARLKAEYFTGKRK